jgi:hypothetical protein
LSIGGLGCVYQSINHCYQAYKQRRTIIAVKGELKGLDGIACEDCGTHLSLQVCKSNAGYYLGYYCDCCGPYSRETGYFKSCEIAERELAKEIPAKLRNTDFVPTDLITEEIILEDEYYFKEIAKRSEMIHFGGGD